MPTTMQIKSTSSSESALLRRYRIWQQFGGWPHQARNSTQCLEQQQKREVDRNNNQKSGPQRPQDECDGLLHNGLQQQSTGEGVGGIGP
jgi:hypothetical protein